MTHCPCCVFVSRIARLVASIRDALSLDVVTETDSIVAICPCGQKNRVRRADFNRGPICGKCRRMLGLPS